MVDIICVDKVVKSALVVGLAVTIAFNDSPATCQSSFGSSWERVERLAIFNTGRTHQIGSGGQIRFELPLTRYTASVLFRESLDNFIIVALSSATDLEN